MTLLSIQCIFTDPTFERQFMIFFFNALPLSYRPVFSPFNSSNRGLMYPRSSAHCKRNINNTHLSSQKHLKIQRHDRFRKLSGLRNFKRNRRNHTFKIKELDVLLKHTETFRTEDIYQKQATMTHSKLPKLSDIKTLHADQCISMSTHSCTSMIPFSLGDKKQSLRDEQSAFIFNKGSLLFPSDPLFVTFYCCASVTRRCNAYTKEWASCKLYLT